jgi:hypothetical protein
MEIGKKQTVRTNVPGARPIILPTRKTPTTPKERPIHVPNWPTKQPVKAPVNVPAGK